jgi:G patch domain-containing protein 1
VALLLSPVAAAPADSVGMRLLQKMGWRPGKGIASAQVDAAGLRGSKWGSVAGVLIENTPLYVLDPKVMHQSAHR